MKYLERKNRMFFDTVRELVEECEKFEVQLWTEFAAPIDSYEELKKEADYKYYYALIVVNFVDEGNYERSITLPVPLLFKSRTKGARLFRNWLKENWDKVVYADRDCYERVGWRKAITNCIRWW